MDQTGNIAELVNIFPARAHFFIFHQGVQVKHLFIALTILCLFAPQTLRADIIPKDMKSIWVSAALQNMHEYPDLVFIQLETLGDEIRSKKVIEKNGIINRGYKFNKLELLAVPKAYFEQHGGLEGIDLLEDPSIYRCTDKHIETGQQLVSRPSHLAGKKVFYHIQSVKNGQIIIERTREESYREHPNHFPINMFLLACIVTLVVELIVFSGLRCTLPAPRPGLLRSLVFVTAAQVTTLPILWFLISRYSLTGPAVIAAAEAFAVAGEGLIYHYFINITS